MNSGIFKNMCCVLVV